MTRQDEVHEFLAKLPATHFFFLYLVGLNVDYETLKDLSHKIFDLVGRGTLLITTNFINFIICFRAQNTPKGKYTKPIYDFDERFSN